MLRPDGRGELEALAATRTHRASAFLTLTERPHDGCAMAPLRSPASRAREMLRFLHQHGRFVAALVRPLVWLVIFAAGFRAVLGLSIIPPYQTYVLYEVYIVPGLAGMMLLFHGMQSSLSMVYDREMGSMRCSSTRPLPRWFLLRRAARRQHAASRSPQVYVFLAARAALGGRPPLAGYVAVLPALVARRA